MIRTISDDIGFETQDSRQLATDELLRSSLPEAGRTWDDIKRELTTLKAGDYDWRQGKVPLYVYYANEELLAVSQGAYMEYFSENALGARAFPSVAQMERALIRMARELFQAPAESAGSFTSGGTESIFLAVKAARDAFRAKHPGVASPRLVLPRTAHPAFDKAAQYLNVEAVRVRVGKDLRVDIGALEGAINSTTMMVVGSAPCYPYGVFDRIDLIGELAAARGIWFHADACLGGFLAPFARDEGYPIPDFDFRIPGVTSLSADFHKYGFSARGASVILYRNARLKEFQGFRFDDWPRGNYATETFLGSRPAGSVASAWAVSQYLGRNGYRQLARRIMEAKARMLEGIGRIQGLEVIRPTELCIVLFKSVDPKVDINAVADGLSERNWFVGRSREPQALHFALNTVHAPVIGRYLEDLGDVVHRVRAAGRVGRYDDNTY